MIYDDGRATRLHLAIQKESVSGCYSPMRLCSSCKKKKSITQFAAGSAACIRCARRSI